MSGAGYGVMRAVLAVVAVWSAGTLAVVESGLGARYSLHPDAALDPADVPAVRLQRGEDLLGPMEKFAVIGERPLFNADRRPAPSEAGVAATDAAPPPAAPLSVVVTSIVITADAKFAIVTDPATKKTQTLRVGQSLEGDQAGWRLMELEPRRAVFDGPGGRSALDLRVFDGTGGEPPTPISIPATASNPPATQRQDGGTEAKEPATAAAEGQADTPESRAEMIRRRIEERRRQMREEAERAQAERGQ